MSDIERVMAESITPVERTSVDDCGKCVFYDFADVCRRVACTNSDNVFSVYWVAKDQKAVLNKDVADRIMRESADRVHKVSQAILAKQIEKQGGR